MLSIRGFIHPLVSSNSTLHCGTQASTAIDMESSGRRPSLNPTRRSRCLGGSHNMWWRRSSYSPSVPSLLEEGLQCGSRPSCPGIIGQIVRLMRLLPAPQGIQAPLSAIELCSLADHFLVLTCFSLLVTPARFLSLWSVILEDGLIVCPGFVLERSCGGASFFKLKCLNFETLVSPTAMVDPITGVGLAAAIVQLIDSTTKVYLYLNDVKQAPKERATLALEAASLLPLLNRLSQSCGGCQPKQPVDRRGSSA